MRRILLTFASTAAAVVLVFSYRTSTGTGDVVAHNIAASGAGVVSAPAATSSAPATSGATAVSTPAATQQVVNGSTVETRFGPVQVQLTVNDGNITAAQAIQYPTAERRDVQINTRAVPILNSEVLTAQSANVDAVSGASYTSDGYVQSLQAALDVLHK